MGATCSSEDARGAGLASLTEIPIGKGLSRGRFDLVFREGKRAVGPLCRISSLPGTGLIGVGTARKIGNTPRRNRARRKFQEALRQNESCIESGLDYVVVVSLAGADSTLGEIVAETGRLVADLNDRWARESACSS